MHRREIEQRSRHGSGSIAAVIDMPRARFTAEEVIEFLIMIKGGDAGRGTGFGPQTGLAEAIEEDRRRQVFPGPGPGLPISAGGSSSTRGQSISTNTAVDNMLRALRGDFTPTKRKKKVSRYHRCVGKHLKALKKKHPRTKQTALLKRAHAACKKQRKREGW